MCGADGNTYTNECEAQRAGVEIIANGECPNVPPELPANYQLFLDYPWLDDLVNPNVCTSEKVEVYQAGIYFYLLITDANGQATLYNQDGLFYCQQTASYNCVSTYNLGQPIDTWQCNSEIGCPTVVMPACGVDGNTYDINPCVMSNGNIEIAYLGTCDPGPVDCDRFVGRAVENECGLFIIVGSQYWKPIFLDGVTPPLPGDFVSFDFFPRSLNDYPDDGCLTNPNGTPPVVGVVSCLSVFVQRGFEAIYTICPGESVFLEARQNNDFPLGPGATCIPNVDDIDIFPSTNTRKEGIMGYEVFPQQSTIYAVESIASCQGGGPIGPNGNPPEPPISYWYYQVIVADNHG